MGSEAAPQRRCTCKNCPGKYFRGVRHFCGSSQSRLLSQRYLSATVRSFLALHRPRLADERSYLVILFPPSSILRRYVHRWQPATSTGNFTAIAQPESFEGVIARAKHAFLSQLSPLCYPPAVHESLWPDTGGLIKSCPICAVRVYT